MQLTDEILPITQQVTEPLVPGDEIIKHTSEKINEVKFWDKDIEDSFYADKDELRYK